MNEKFSQFLPKAIALILIAAIFVVALSILNNQEPPAHSGVPSNLTNNENDENQNPPDPPGPQPEPYYTTYPKQAAASENFLYEQQLSGYGNIEIKNLLQTTNSLYAVLECGTLFGDITTEKKSVALAKISLLGAVEKVLVLPSRLDTFYLSSKITAAGLMIMTKTAENILVFNAQYNLNSAEVCALPIAQKGRLFLTQEGCLMLAEGAANTIYIKKDELQTGFLPSGEILDIFDFYQYLLIVINTQNGYNIIKLSPALKILQNTVIEGCKALAITPYAENGQQRFLVVERTAAVTKLWKYSSSFNKIDAQNTIISNSENIKLLPRGDKILAIFSGSTKGIYLFNKDLECALANISALQNINEIYGYISYNNGCYLLADAFDGLNIIDYRFDNTHSVYNMADSTASAFFCLNTNNTLSVFYNCLDEYCAVKIAGVAA